MAKNTGIAPAGSGDLRRIRETLRAWDRRLRMQQTVMWLPRGLGVGLALGVLLVAAARIWPLLPRDRLVLAVLALSLAGALLAALGVWLWRRTPLETARRFDHLLGLKERLSTALELAGGELPVESAALAATQQADAARTLDRVDVARALPVRARWQDWAPAGAAALVLAAGLMLPNPQEEALAQQAEIEAALAEQLEELEALREQALEDPALTDEQEAALIETLDEVIETLSQRDVTQEEAFAALDAAERDLRELAQEQQADRRESLMAAAEGMRQAGAEAEAIAEQLGQGDFQSAGESLSDMLDNVSAADAGSMAGQLDQMAESLDEIDPEVAEALREAAEALRRGDRDAARAAGERAATRISEAGDALRSELDEYADRLDQGGKAMAQAGRPPGSAAQPGQSGMGQAQPGGQGQGEGGGEGDGLDPGQLTGDTPRGGGAPDGGEREAEIYTPLRIGGEGGEQIDIPGEPESVPIQEGELAENPTGEARVPYSEVFGDYAESVNEALESGYIPLGRRGLIQQYFSRLNPEE